MNYHLNIADPFSLKGKTILITGASSGIGQAIAISCAARGAKLLLLARNAERLEDTRKQCHNPSSHAIISIDLGSDHWEALSTFLRTHAPIHGFVHAAGVSPTVPLKVLKREQVLDTFQLNVFSAISLTQLLTKSGIRNETGMSMVMIASVMSEVGEKGKMLYGMTKASIVSMVKSLALEYAVKNIRFNAISPAVVNTPLSLKSEYRKDYSTLSAVTDMHPLGLGEVHDVAHAAVYLLADASKWVTGTNLVVDGGYLAK